MIKEYKKNETQYIKKCKYCKSTFIYENEDYYSDYSYGKKHIRCPYCREVNKIRFKIVFKNNEQMQEDYKKELDNLKTKFDDVRNEKLKRIIELNEEKKQIVNKYKALEERLEHKENKIKKYINDYMSSDKKSNIAIKHLKEILKILEEIE